MKRLLSLVLLVVVTAGIAYGAIHILSGNVRAADPGRMSQDSPATRPYLESKVYKVYLTFDDGPNSHFTEQVLEVLNDYDVPATFFVLGSNARRHPELLQRMIAEGHTVGNHSYNHDYSLYGQPDAYRGDLEKTQSTITSAIGDQPLIYRPPGGTDQMNSDNRAILKELGYKYYGWDVSSCDTDTHGVVAQQLIDNVVKGVLEMPEGSQVVVLMHDGNEVSSLDPPAGTAEAKYVQNRKADVEALPVIITELRKHGAIFYGLKDYKNRK